MRNLPDKQEWADELLALMKKEGISKLHLSKVSKLSRPTIISALRGETSYDVMLEVQKSIIKEMRGK